MKRQTKAERQIEARINHVYCKHCSGLQINIMNIGKVFAEGERWIHGNPAITDGALGAALRAFVLTLE